MRLSIDFDALVTFDCTYGAWSIQGDLLRIFVEKGLVVKHCKLISELDGFSLVKCGGPESDHVEKIFPVHYIYDAARQVEYTEWELVDGLLRGRSKEGGWVQYTNKSESSYAMHEFVGGCWFVFTGISFSKKTVVEYAPDRKSSTGLKVVQELVLPVFTDVSSKDYFLEGVLNAPPGPGWMSWKIHANAFYIEIPES